MNVDRQWIEESFELIASSDPQNGAVPLSQTGDRFQVIFNEPIGIPKGAIDPTVQCMGANIWWTIPNIVGSGPTQNNLFGFVYSRLAPDNVTTAQVQITVQNNLFGFRYASFSAINLRIPPGFYSFTALYNAFIEQMVAAAVGVVGENDLRAWFQMGRTVTGLTIILLDQRPPYPAGVTTSTVTLGSLGPLNIGPTENLGWPASAVPVVFSGVQNTVVQITSPLVGRFTLRLQGQGIPVPTGLYNVDQLDTQVKLSMVDYGLTFQEADAFISFEGDESRQITVIRMTNAPNVDFGTEAPFTFTFGDGNGLFGFDGLLGFTSWPPPGTNKTLVSQFPGSVFTGQSVAAFNTVDYLLLHTDLVPRGIRFNGDFAQIVAQVNINVNTGNQIDYSPQNPPICDGANLVGAQRTRATFWMTDDQNQPVDTFGETWTIRLLFKYKIAKLA
jgi:hypothetical protein